MAQVLGFQLQKCGCPILSSLRTYPILPRLKLVQSGLSVLFDFTKLANLSDFTRAENWSVLPDFTKVANLSAFTRPENWFVLPDFTKAENWSVLADFTKHANLSDFTRAENWSVLPDFTWILCHSFNPKGASRV
jgi:hypothetical protein